MDLKDNYGKIEELFSVKNQVVLITGAGGLAEMYAYGFAKNGATVVIASKTMQKAERICEKLRTEQVPCLALNVQIEKKDQVQKMIDCILEQFGKIDICIHTAAVCVRHNTLEDHEELFRTHVDVNMIGSLNINRMVGNVMAARGKGRIININTMSCDTVNTPDGFSYGVTKAALKQITKWFAVAYAKKGVTVNGIAPVWIDTPMMACRSQDYWNHCMDQVPMGRVAVPEDYLGIALYMASEAGRYMTGQTVFVDGGWQVSRVFRFDEEQQ
ncbi:MAG: SDR family oxidoreductase [Clostridiales bacterium]|nr:SDR family oxidoreductase [Clostridiales bacterium]